jgi:hypothetical protein
MKHDENRDIQVDIQGQQQLPEPFADLAPYLAWALPTERERSARRQASPMTEISAFYKAMLPRMGEILSYLAQYPLDNVPSDVQRLFYLSLALAEVAPAVENFGQPSVVEGYDVARFVQFHE